MINESKATIWRRNNPEKWRKQRLKYRNIRNQKRREKYALLSIKARRQLSKLRAERRKADPNTRQKEREYQRLAVLRSCGMTLSAARRWYSNMPKVCEICGSVERIGIDHNHDTKQIRGMLCRTCNLGLGHLRDDEQLLRKALQYLNKYRKVTNDSL